MADIHEIIRNIRGKTALSENLPAYVSAVKKDAARLSHTDLSLHAAALYEDELKDGALSEEASEIMKALFAYLSGALDLSDCISLRKKNAERMQAVSAAIDSYKLAEFLMNRIEHRFIGERELPADYSDLEFSGEIMAWISQKKDEARGIAVSEILEQLPVRMTKERFLEILIQRLGIYRASDTEAFSGILSQLVSAAALENGDFSYAPLPALSEILNLFREKNPQDITEEEFRTARGRLGELSVQLNRDSERCSLRASVLNNLETLLLTGEPDPGSPEYGSAHVILENSARLMEKLPESDEQLLSDTMALCSDLEGHLEEAFEDYTESISFAEDLCNRFAEDIEKEGLSEAYGNLLMIRDLRSESTYPEERSERKTPEPLSDDLFDRKVREMLSMLSDAFRESRRNYVRAVMGRILFVLPPVFRSAEEIENYIYAALTSCRNTEEKLGCIELCTKLMEQ